MSLILIVGDESEHQIASLAASLRKQKHEVHCFLFSDFPQSLAVSWSPEQGIGHLHIEDQSINFEHIDSVYWHRSDAVSTSNSQSSAWLKKESQSCLSPFIHCNSIRWINSFNAIQYHQNKPRQLSHAVKLGAIIPPTYIGNDAKKSEAFLNQHSECIFKPVQGGMTTKKVVAAQRNYEHLSSVLNKAPITLQALVGNTNIRTYVIDNQLFSAELRSDSVDFRDDSAIEAKPIALPATISDLARRICRGFGMEWCAIDWRVDSQGNYYFLEANPCPYFSKFEIMTGLPIESALSKLLTAD